MTETKTANHSPQVKGLKKIKLSLLLLARKVLGTTIVTPKSEYGIVKSTYHLPAIIDVSPTAASRVCSFLELKNLARLKDIWIVLLFMKETNLVVNLEEQFFIARAVAAAGAVEWVVKQFILKLD